MCRLDLRVDAPIVFLTADHFPVGVIDVLTLQVAVEHAEIVLQIVQRCGRNLQPRSVLGLHARVIRRQSVDIDRLRRAAVRGRGIAFDAGGAKEFDDLAAGIADRRGFVVLVGSDDRIESAVDGDLHDRIRTHVARHRAADMPAQRDRARLIEGLAQWKRQHAVGAGRRGAALRAFAVAHQVVAAEDLFVEILDRPRAAVFEIDDACPRRLQLAVHIAVLQISDEPRRLILHRRRVDVLIRGRVVDGISRHAGPIGRSAAPERIAVESEIVARGGRKIARFLEGQRRVDAGDAARLALPVQRVAIRIVDGQRRQNLAGAVLRHQGDVVAHRQPTDVVDTARKSEAQVAVLPVFAVVAEQIRAARHERSAADCGCIRHVARCLQVVTRIGLRETIVGIPMEYTQTILVVAGVGAAQIGGNRIGFAGRPEQGVAAVGLCDVERRCYWRAVVPLA